MSHSLIGWLLITDTKVTLYFDFAKVFQVFFEKNMHLQRKGRAEAPPLCAQEAENTADAKALSVYILNFFLQQSHMNLLATGNILLAISPLMYWNSSPYGSMSYA